MDSTVLEEFKKEMQQLMEKALNQPEFNECFKRYGLSDQEVGFPLVLNLDKIREINQSELKDSLQTVIGEELKLFGCCLVNGCIKCNPWF
ncbi:hypothetical protein [Mastigocoleus testarum]|uniref:Uncharacterized protein n=1 Tax=Mastigocoleus testarum BC008 TaxID=371196 RepID=A0A0V7ZRB5_9CYAN|nr:hypothetical protein [Mastigocoleus testarum]KST66945.1 hypothetical protein BC008_27530 [Mastigocoleus testarum BC008]KST67166.1 hypothetical protein BC008_28650 [Mastigocoleus testarum BC008]